MRGEQVLRCDFCGREVDSVRRVAIDKDYDRLSVKHQIKYACEECSRKKEAERKARLSLTEGKN